MAKIPWGRRYDAAVRTDRRVCGFVQRRSRDLPHAATFGEPPEREQERSEPVDPGGVEGPDDQQARHLRDPVEGDVAHARMLVAHTDAEEPEQQEEGDQPRARQRGRGAPQQHGDEGCHRRDE